MALGINDDRMFDRLGISIDGILYRGLVKRLEAFAEEAPGLVSRTWVWIPGFQEDFLLFDFDDLQEQYELTSKWAESHDPVPLEEFLLKHREKNKPPAEITR